ALSKSVPLHLAAADLAFDLSGRLLEASQDIGRMRVALTLDEQGAGHYRADFQPASDTPLGKALTAARLLTAPSALWQLPYDTKIIRPKTDRAPQLVPNPHSRGSGRRLCGPDRRAAQGLSRRASAHSEGSGAGARARQTGSGRTESQLGVTSRLGRRRPVHRD